MTVGKPSTGSTLPTATHVGHHTARDRKLAKRFWEVSAGLAEVFDLPKVRIPGLNGAKIDPDGGHQVNSVKIVLPLSTLQ